MGDLAVAEFSHPFPFFFGGLSGPRTTNKAGRLPATPHPLITYLIDKDMDAHAHAYSRAHIMAQQNGRFGLPHNFPQLFLGGGSGRGPPPRPSVDGPFPATPAPTAETQELYNKMKQIESELDLGDRIKLQGGHGGESSPVELLEPPTPSQADTMSRSPSVRSHTHSLPYGSNPVDIADVVEQEERVGKKRRAVRRGPLDSYTKARAALLRKLGVCDGCRERKVRVGFPFLSPSPSLFPCVCLCARMCVYFVREFFSCLFQGGKHTGIYHTLRRLQA